MRPHFGSDESTRYYAFGDVVYEKLWLETDITKSTSRGIRFSKFSTKNMVWKLCCLFKLYIYQSPCYLFNILTTKNRFYQFRDLSNLHIFKVKYNFLKTLFSSSLIEQNNFDSNIRNSVNIPYR